MRKLVKKDENGRLTEVDVKAMRREALALQRYIDEAPAAEKAEFKYHEWLQPVIDAALDGTLRIPYMHQPYNFRLMDEGLLPWLPEQFLERYVRFLARIEGAVELSSCSTIEGGGYIPRASEEIIDGDRYEWVIFED